MTNVPLPAEMTRIISQTAVSYARQNAISRGWKSAEFILPNWGNGFAGMRVTKQYLMYQERGTKPRLMTELEGKLIPIKGADGARRIIRAKDVGKPGWVTLPDGVKVWRNQKWLNPGIQATHFMQQSIDYAIRDSKDQIMGLMNQLIGNGQ